MTRRRRKRRKEGKNVRGDGRGRTGMSARDKINVVYGMRRDEGRKGGLEDPGGIFQLH